MENKFLDFELDADDVRLYAQFTSYMKLVMAYARRDYLEKEANYRKALAIEIVPLDEQSDVGDPDAVAEIERIINWEMIKSHLKVLTLREAEVVNCLFINRMTQEECAKQLGVSRPRVTTLYKNALTKLKESMEADEYGDF